MILTCVCFLLLYNQNFKLWLFMSFFDILWLFYDFFTIVYYDFKSAFPRWELALVVERLLSMATIMTSLWLFSTYYMMTFLDILYYDFFMTFSTYYTMTFSYFLWILWLFSTKNTWPFWDFFSTYYTDFFITFSPCYTMTLNPLFPDGN